MTTGQAPDQQVIQRELPAVATATTTVTEIGESLLAGTIVGASYAPAAAIAGAATNTRRLRLINKGQAGVGAAVPASIEFDAGINGVAYQAKALALSATPSDLVVAVGDVLAVESAAIGTGLADPGGLMVVTISRS